MRKINRFDVATAVAFRSPFVRQPNCALQPAECVEYLFIVLQNGQYNYLLFFFFFPFLFSPFILHWTNGKRCTTMWKTQNEQVICVAAENIEQVRVLVCRPKCGIIDHVCLATYRSLLFKPKMVGCVRLPSSLCLYIYVLCVSVSM